MSQKLIGIKLDKNGSPRIFGSRIKISTLLNYLSEGKTLDEFCNDYSVSKKRCMAVLHELSFLFSKSLRQIKKTNKDNPNESQSNKNTRNKRK